MKNCDTARRPGSGGGIDIFAAGQCSGDRRDLEPLPGELRGADGNRLAAWLKSGLDEGSEDRSPEALRWSGLSALYDLYTRDPFTPPMISFPLPALPLFLTASLHKKADTA